jgi:hypothetical protein
MSMPIYSHISSLYSAPWVSWVLFGLLVIAQWQWLTINRHGALSLSSIYSQAERTYNIHRPSPIGTILQHFFRWCIVAIAANVLVSPVADFTPIFYLKTVGIVMVIYTIQWICLQVVGNVFLSPKIRSNAMEQYSHIRTLACLLLYPILLILTNIPHSQFDWWLIGAVAACYLLTLLWKCFQIFYKNILTLLYISLYVVFLELLPIAGVIVGVKHIVCV